MRDSAITANRYLGRLCIDSQLVQHAFVRVGDGPRQVVALPIGFQCLYAFRRVRANDVERESVVVFRSNLFLDTP